MNHAQILITGGTGTVGRELVSLFSTNHVPARVLVRTTSATIRKVAPIEYAVGDLTNPLSLESALDGIRKVFLLSSDSPEQASIETAFIDLAVSKGVKHIVKLSGFVAGTQPPISFGRQLNLVENKIQHSGIQWTILRPYMFMQNFLSFADMISSNGFFVGPFGRGRVSFVDVRDIATVAFNVLTGPGHESRIYEITGPEALSFNDAANIISEVLDRRVRYFSVPSFIGRLGMTKQGIPKWNAAMIIELSQIIRTNAESKVTDTVEKIGRKKPFTFREFMQAYKTSFKKSIN